MNIRVLFLMLALTTAVQASPTNGAARWVSQAILQMPDTLRTRMLAAIGRGDFAEAISLWELQAGKTAPQWLIALQSAFSTSNQKTGPCIQVARSVFEGFKQLGRKPTYVEFTTSGTHRGANLIGFDLPMGARSKTIQISENAVHYAVQIEDRVYDAMTGPAGLPLAEYMARLQSPGTISMKIVSQLP